MGARSDRQPERAGQRNLRFDGLRAHLPDWSGLDDVLLRRLRSHGDFDRWRQAVLSLPAPPASSVSFDDTVTVSAELPAAEVARLRNALQALHPWRKGPFSLYGVRIDSEWRSDFKWRRIAPHLDLEGLRILDIGCGNGYYGWRMLGAGAALVIGIDPSVLFCMQHRAINRFIGDDRNQVLPLELESLPEALSAGRFDAVFSMGVIYHRRDPLAHLRRMARCLVPGGAPQSSRASVSRALKHWFPMAATPGCATCGRFRHDNSSRTGCPNAAFRRSASRTTLSRPRPNNAQPTGCVSTRLPKRWTRPMRPAPWRGTRLRGAACLSHANPGQPVR